jgi:hypothetical protein
LKKFAQINDFASVTLMRPDITAAPPLRQRKLAAGCPLIFIYFIKQQRRSTSFLLKLFVTQNINYAVHRWIRLLPGESLSGFADSAQKLCTLYFNVERVARAKVVPHLPASIIHYDMCESRQRVRERAAFLF